MWSQCVRACNISQAKSDCSVSLFICSHFHFCFLVGISLKHGVTPAEKPQHLWQHEEKRLTGLTAQISFIRRQKRVCFNMCLSVWFHPDLWPPVSCELLSGNKQAPSGWVWRPNCWGKELSLALDRGCCWAKTGCKTPLRGPIGPDYAFAEKHWDIQNRYVISGLSMFSVFSLGCS